MEQINQKQLIDKLQRHYDSLVSFANNANKNSKQNLPPAVQQLWTVKAEAYAYAALQLDASMAAIGIILNSKPLHSEIEADHERREHCAADLDEHERAIAYEHH